MSLTLNRHRRLVLVGANRSSSTVVGPFNQKQYRGLIVYLRLVSISGGTAGIKLIIRARDFLGNLYDISDGGDPITTAPSNRLYILYPSTLDAANGSIAETIQLPLPEVFELYVQHLDGGTYNYQIEVEYIE